MMKKIFTLLLPLILFSCGTSSSSRNTNITTASVKQENSVLPQSIFGEWLDPTGNKEYNGVLIHPDFIEYGYTAYRYNKITKVEDHQYEFTGKDTRGQISSFELKVLNDQTITLRLGKNANRTYIKQDHPEMAQSVSMAEVPQAVKNSWYSTEGENNLVFRIDDKKITFKGEDYAIDQVMHFDEPDLEQYRFVVSNDEKSWLFYVKAWSEDHVQIGYNGETGAIYKSNKSFSTSSDSLPQSAFGEWFNPEGKNEYNGVLIQPDFIEYNYTAFGFDEIEKINDTDYRFKASADHRSISGILSVLNENTIRLNRIYRLQTPMATYIKKDLPHDATQVSLKEVPDQVKGAWSRSESAKDVEFEITDTQFKFNGHEYEVDEVMHIEEPKMEQYRFIVSNGNKTMMFYFKNWRTDFIQVGYSGQKGGLYKRI